MNNTKLFKYFAGKAVHIVMRSVKGAQVLGEGMIAEGSVILGGFLLDEDEHFYYIGSTQEEVDEALRKDDLVRMYINDEEIGLIIDEDDIGADRH